MKALRSFTVRPTLPAELAALESLAMNLRWSWDEQTRDLFRWVDPEQWDASIHDPVRLLGLVSKERLETLAADCGRRRFSSCRNTRPAAVCTLHSIAVFAPVDVMSARARPIM